MKLSNVHQVNEFLAVVDACVGDVWLQSQYGDRINLKSKLSQYVAIAALIHNQGGELELFCADKGDEVRFLNLLVREPDIL